MGEVAYMNEGDLEAIVRGYLGSGDAFSGESSGGFSPPFCLPIETASFYEPEKETTGLDELGELYKPFYPFSTQTILTSSVSVPGDSRSFRYDKRQRTHGCLLSNRSRVDVRIPVSKSKKSKKNQLKRVVEQVKEENLLSDAWAWRKYGQKPIKGSPYPRSYYRCSSSKGCLARKQVERNPQNPEKFTITYTNEHNHELPTRRNSLAGSTRAKSSQTKHSVTKKSGKQVISSPTSNLMITSTDESSVAVQDSMRVAETSTYQTNGETEGTSNTLPSDLLTGTGSFPTCTGDFDDLLNSQEFLDGYLWNYQRN